MADTTNIEEPKEVLGLNKNIDIGCLLVEDCQSYQNISDKEFSKRTAANLCSLYRELFDLKKKQRAAFGEDGEILEYTKALYSVDLPSTKVVFPREKPCPAEKVKTKWEKFREERGLPPRKKRSRLVFDPITKDWVPRWGAGSIKKIADKHQWVMEDKPKHTESGIDPYTFAKMEKKKQLEKQNLAQLKNKVNAVKASDMKRDVKILAPNKSASGSDGAPKSAKESLKLREEQERAQLRKREHKSLMKSLTLA